MIHDVLFERGDLPVTHVIYMANEVLPDDPDESLVESFDDFMNAGVNVLPFSDFAIILKNNKHFIDKSELTEQGFCFAFYEVIYKDNKNHVTTDTVITCNGQILSSKKDVRVHGDIVNKNNLGALEYFKMLVMILQSKHVEHTTTDISKALNKSRERSMKAPLRPYVTVTLSKKARAHLTDSATGILRRPHWRRGHLRNLPSGVVTSVRACIVGLRDDDKEPEARPYIVRR